MTEHFKLSDRARNVFFGMIALGVIGMIFTFFLYPENHHSRFWSNLLLNTYLFTGISLVGLFFVAGHQQGWGGWITALKRVPEAIASFIYVIAFFGVLIIIGTYLDWHNLYAHWSQHQDEPAIKGKSALLNKNTWSAINLIFYGLWVLLIFWYRKTSQDEDNGTVYASNLVKLRKIAAIFLVVFGVSESIFSWTFVMSIDPHWYSTLFGWYNFASYTCAGIAFMVLIVLYLKSRGYLKLVNENHLHDLGTFMFGFTVFWMYLWFSQFMLQWYANVPEDTIFWTKRWNVGWFKFWFYAVLVLNFLIPFLFLLGRGAKRRNGRMILMALVIICGHYMDFYNLIMYEPNAIEHEHKAETEKKESALMKQGNVLYAQADHGTSDSKMDEKKVEAKGDEISHEHKSEGHSEEAETHHAGLGFPEISIFLGFIGMFLFWVFSTLSKGSLVPTNDAYLKESMNHHI